MYYKEEGDRALPSDTSRPLAEGQRYLYQRKPTSMLEALMASTPSHEEEFDEDDLAAKDRLAELIDDVLTDKERWIINALYWEGKSLQEVADDLGFSNDGKKNKTLVVYYRDKALEKLRGALVGEDIEVEACEDG